MLVNIIFADGRLVTPEICMEHTLAHYLPPLYTIATCDGKNTWAPWCLWFTLFKEDILVEGLWLLAVPYQEDTTLNTGYIIAPEYPIKELIARYSSNLAVYHEICYRYTHHLPITSTMMICLLAQTPNIHARYRYTFKEPAIAQNETLFNLANLIPFPSTTTLKVSPVPEWVRNFNVENPFLNGFLIVNLFRGILIYFSPQQDYVMMFVRSVAHQHTQFSGIVQCTIDFVEKRQLSPQGPRLVEMQFHAQGNDTSLLEVNIYFNLSEQVPISIISTWKNNVTRYKRSLMQPSVPLKHPCVVPFRWQPKDIVCSIAWPRTLEHINTYYFFVCQ